MTYVNVVVIVACYKSDVLAIYFILTDNNPHCYRKNNQSCQGYFLTAVMELSHDL